MSERTIILRAEQVRAIRAGATQVRVPFSKRAMEQWIDSGCEIDDDGQPCAMDDLTDWRELAEWYWLPGDVLRVREPWCFFDRYAPLAEAFEGPIDPKSLPAMCADGSELGEAVMSYWRRRLVYAADAPFPHIEHPKWRSAATMPAWAARMWLTVERVRAQRVEEITEADALAMRPEPTTSGAYYFGDDDRIAHTTASYAYRSYWRKRHGCAEWAWVLTVRQTEGPKQ